MPRVVLNRKSFAVDISGHNMIRVINVRYLKVFRMFFFLSVLFVSQSAENVTNKLYNGFAQFSNFFPGLEMILRSR